MLRTTLSTAGARSAFRNPSVLKSNFRPSNVSITTPLRSVPRRAFTSTRNTRSSKSSTSFTFSSSRPISRNSTILQRLRNSFRNFHGSRPRFSDAGGIPKEESLGLTARMKKLSREYGWSVVGVYFMLSALDFPFCYLLVKYVGTEVIGHWEEVIVSYVQQVIPESVKQTWHDWRGSFRKTEHAITGHEDVNDHIDQVEQDVKTREKKAIEGTTTATSADAWGVEEARIKVKRDASLATQLALAYAIHKSFIFIRVPLTAAITPKVVKILRGWGWDIGKRTTAEAKAIKRASMPAKPKARWAGKSNPK